MTFSSFVSRLACCAALLGGAACSSEKDPAPAAAPRSSLRWAVNGVLATAQEAHGEASPAGVLGISGAVSGGGERRFVMLFVPNRPGTYALPAPGGTSALYQVLVDNNPGASAGYPATAGAVTVSAYTASPALGESHAVGAFSFSGPRSGGTGTAAITDGTFDVYF